MRLQQKAAKQEAVVAEHARKYKELEEKRLAADMANAWEKARIEAEEAARAAEDLKPEELRVAQKQTKVSIVEK